MSRYPPLYPLLLNIFSIFFAQNFLLSAIVLSVGLTITASVYLYKLVAFEFASRSAALWTVLFFSISPTRYFLLAPYSESLFLLLLIMYFYYSRLKSMHGIATLIYAGALLTRVFGVFMYPVHLYFSIDAIRKSKHLGEVAWQVFLLVLPGLVLGVYQLFVRWFLNSDGYLNSSEASSISLGIPFSELFNTVATIIRTPQILGDEYFLHTIGFTAIFMLVIMAITAVGIKRTPHCYTIYSLSFILGSCPVNVNVS